MKLSMELLFHLMIIKTLVKNSKSTFNFSFFVIKFLICTIFTLTNISNSKSNENTKCNGIIQFGFFNGVLNTERQARLSLNITTELLRKKSAETKIKGIIYYNTSQGALSDIGETFSQRLDEKYPEISNHTELFFPTLKNDGVSRSLYSNFPSWELFVEDIFTLSIASINQFSLENHLVKDHYVKKYLDNKFNKESNSDYKQQNARLNTAIKNHDKLLFIAHSQGNLFVNKAYEYLKSKKYDQSLIKIIHVAPASTVLHGDHVLADKDLVINALRLSNSGDVASVTDIIPKYDYRKPGLDLETDFKGHGYLSIYLNPSLTTYTHIMKDASEILSEFSCNSSLPIDGLKNGLKAIDESKPPRNIDLMCDSYSCTGAGVSFFKDDRPLFNAVQAISNECREKTFLMRNLSGRWNKKSNVYEVRCTSIFNVPLSSGDIPINMVKIGKRKN